MGNVPGGAGKDLAEGLRQARAGRSPRGAPPCGSTVSGGVIVFILSPKPLPLSACSLQHLPCFTSLESQLTPGETRAESNHLCQECVNLITNLPWVEMPPGATGKVVGTGVRVFAREFLVACSQITALTTLPQLHIGGRLALPPL